MKHFSFLFVCCTIWCGTLLQQAQAQESYMWFEGSGGVYECNNIYELDLTGLGPYDSLYFDILAGCNGDSIWLSDVYSSAAGEFYVDPYFEIWYDSAFASGYWIPNGEDSISICANIYCWNEVDEVWDSTVCCFYFMIIDNHPPEIYLADWISGDSLLCGDTITVFAGDSVVVEICAWDPDYYQFVTLIEGTVPDSVFYYGDEPPVWDSLTVCVMMVWLPQGWDVGLHWVEYFAYDDDSALVSCGFYVDVRGNPPQFEPAELFEMPVVLTLGDSLFRIIQVLDPDSTDSLWVELLSPLPEGATITPALPQFGASPLELVLEWRPGCNQLGTHLIYLYAVDQFGLEAYGFIEIEVIDGGDECDGGSCNDSPILVYGTQDGQIEHLTAMYRNGHLVLNWDPLENVSMYEVLMAEELVEGGDEWRSIGTTDGTPEFIVPNEYIRGPLASRRNYFTIAPRQAIQMILAGELACWPMDEGGGDVVEDLAQFNNAGTIVGAEWFQGPSGHCCLRFGYGDYVTLENDVEFYGRPLELNACCSISSYPTVQSGPYYLFSCHRYATWFEGFGVRIDNGGRVMSEVWDQSINNWRTLRSATRAVPLNEPFKVTAIINGANSALLVNDVVVASGTQPYNSVTNGFDMTIGAHNYNDDRYQYHMRGDIHWMKITQE